METDDHDFVADRRREPQESSLSYTIPIVAIIGFVCSSITCIAIWAPANIGVAKDILAFVGPSVLIMLTVMKQSQTHSTVSQLRDALNGHLRQFVSEIRQAAIEEGKRAPRTPREGQRQGQPPDEPS